MDTVKLVCGQQPQYFPFGNDYTVTPPIITTTTAIPSRPIPKDGVYATYQATLRGTSGAQAATVSIYATNDPLTAGQDDTVNRKFLNFAIGTTNTSTTITSANGYFRTEMTGMQVFAPGVTLGTTFTYVSASSGTLSAAATATATVQAHFQATSWVLLGTITLAGTATTSVSDGFATAAGWKWTYANVSAISGTGATVQVIQGL